MIALRAAMLGVALLAVATPAMAQRPRLEVSAGVATGWIGVWGTGPHVRLAIDAPVTPRIRAGASAGFHRASGSGDPTACRIFHPLGCTGRRDRVRMWEATVSARLNLLRSPNATFDVVLLDIGVYSADMRSTEWQVPPSFGPGNGFSEVTRRSRTTGPGLGTGVRTTVLTSWFYDFRMHRMWRDPLPDWRFVFALGKSFE